MIILVLQDLIASNTEFDRQMTKYLEVLEANSRGRSSCPGMIENVHFSISFRPALEHTQPPIQ
jgi:hypothetical protein